MFVVLFVLFAILTRGEKHSDLVVEEEGPKVSAAEGFRSATSVLIMFSMLFLAIIVAMASCYMPTYCNSVLGLDILKANSLTSLMSVSMIVSGLVMGIVLNKTKKHLTIFFAGAVLTAILGFFTFLFPQNIAVVYLILLGFFPQAMYATLFTIAPSAARSPETVSVTIGLISFGQLMAGIAVTIGGAVIDRMGFSVCSYGLGIIGILLVVCVIAFNLAMKKKAAQAK